MIRMISSADVMLSSFVSGFLSYYPLFLLLSFAVPVSVALFPLRWITRRCKHVPQDRMDLYTTAAYRISGLCRRIFRTWMFWRGAVAVWMCLTPILAVLHKTLPKSSSLNALVESAVDSLIGVAVVLAALVIPSIFLDIAFDLIGTRL